MRMSTESDNVAKVVGQFGIQLVSIKTLSVGLMHGTFKVDSEKGSYILQKLHPLLSSDAVLQDFVHVTDHLHARGFSAPVALRTVSDDIVFRDGSYAYRMYTFVPGQTVTSAKDEARVHEAGKIVGRFHEIMQDFGTPFESTLILHQTPLICRELIETLETFATDELLDSSVRELGTTIIETLPTLYLPASLPRRPAHGDLKISNILFNEKGEAVSLIDFDTCNRMPVPVEMGDAFRSWCGNEEDDPDNAFSLERFAAGWKGYSSQVTHLTLEEREYIVQGILLITLELTARFLIDYFKDSYFGWDQNRYQSRRLHNLARAKGQSALFASLLNNRNAAESIVTDSRSV